jgi:hypothetical protein
MLRHMLLYVRDVKCLLALFGKGPHLSQIMQELTISVQCGLWEGLRQITSIFNQESCFKVKAALSSDIRIGNFPYPLREAEDVRCFDGGGEICYVFGTGMFFTVSCYVLLSGILGFFSP